MKLFPPFLKSEWNYSILLRHLYCLNSKEWLELISLPLLSLTFQSWFVSSPVQHHHHRWKSCTLCVTVLLFQPCSVVILTRSWPALRGIKLHIYFRPGFVASSDFTQGLSLSIEHCLCEIQACSTTHVTYVWIFNRLRHNRLASTLDQVIWLDLASTWSQGLSMHRCISFLVPKLFLQISLPRFLKSYFQIRGPRLEYTLPTRRQRNLKLAWLTQYWEWVSHNRQIRCQEKTIMTLRIHRQGSFGYV